MGFKRSWPLVHLAEEKAEATVLADVENTRFMVG